MLRVIQVLAVCGMLGWLLVAPSVARADKSEVLMESVTAVENVDGHTRVTLTGSFDKQNKNDIAKLSTRLEIKGNKEGAVSTQVTDDGKGTLNFRVQVDFSHYMSPEAKAARATLTVGSTKLGTFRNMALTRNEN